MLYYFTEVSKYIICAFMILYTIECVLYEISGENYVNCKGIVTRQRIYLLIIQACCYGTLCLRTGELDYMFFCFFVQIVLFACIILTGYIYPRCDRVLLNNMALLLSIGFIVISRLNFDKALKQFAIVAASIVIGMFVPKIIKDWKTLIRYKWIFAISGIVPLLIVLVLGTATHGSKISFTVFGITVQPSEFIKLLFVICVASMLSTASDISEIALATAVAASHVVILVASRDLGSALVFFVAYLFMLFIATRNYIYFAIGIISGVVASIIGYKLFSHVRVRVQAFLDPFSTIDNQGYQISQSLFSISSGGFFGLGLNKGIPSDIPFVESDFIFSAVCEELGVIFASCMLLVCFSCFVIIMRGGLAGRIKYYRILNYGLGVMYIFQVFLTVGGGAKFIPLTGVTLPFVSYGGSSVLSSVIMFYLAQGVIIKERDLEYEEYKEELEKRRKHALDEERRRRERKRAERLEREYEERWERELEYRRDRRDERYDERYDDRYDRRDERYDDRYDRRVKSVRREAYDEEY